jgi:hypothetical protein
MKHIARAIASPQIYYLNTLNPEHKINNKHFFKNSTQTPSWFVERK